MPRISLIRAVALAVVFGGQLVACAPAPVIYTDLRHPVVAKSFVIEAPIVDIQKVGLTDWTYGLGAGVYRARYENESGTLYEGPGQCVLLHHAKGFRVQAGGVFVSRTQGELPRLYVVAHQAFTDYPDLNGALQAQKVAAAPSDNSKRQGTGETPLLLDVGGPPATIPEAVGSAIGIALTQAAVEKAIADERGKPLSLFHVGSKELRRAISTAQQ